MTPRRIRLFLLLSPVIAVLAFVALVTWHGSQPPQVSELTRGWNGFTLGTKGLFLTPGTHTMRSPELRADGTFVLDAFVPGEGRWRIEGDQVVLNFQKVDGAPIERFNHDWPARREAMLLRTWKQIQGGHNHGHPQDRGKPYATWRKEVVGNYPRVLDNPYQQPWIFRLRRNAITTEGLQTQLEQQGDGYTHVVLKR